MSVRVDQARDEGASCAIKGVIGGEMSFQLSAPAHRYNFLTFHRDRAVLDQAARTVHTHDNAMSQKPINGLSRHGAGYILSSTDLPDARGRYIKQARGRLTRWLGDKL